MKNEIWKDIKGYKGLYQISNNGEVKTLGRKRILILKGKKKIINYKCKILKCGDRKGYKSVTLCKNKIKKYYTIHRLVALHFIKNKTNKPCINHIDNNILNNYYKNLEWCTVKENNLHGYIHGNHKSYMKKIEQYSKDGKYIQTFKSIIDAAKKYNTVYSNISNAAKGLTKSAKGYIWKYA